MDTIIIYTYLIGYILFYIFFQLNYMFSWFEELEMNEAIDAVFWGLPISLFWPIIVIIGLAIKIMLWMDNVHYKHKYKHK